MFHSAKIRWLGSGEPFSEQFQDFYFSSDGGLLETEYVFLKQNNFPQVFKELTDKDSQPVFKIAETGFGTGLNFLITALHWLQTPDLNCTLEYTSVEKYPLSKLNLTQIFSIFKKNWPQLSPYCDDFLKIYPQDFLKDSTLNSQQNHFQFELFEGKIILNLLIDDAASALTQLLTTHSTTIDAWYLDGFSPAKNPEMWQQALFESIAGLSKPGATFSTFTSAGFVRRGLEDAGFKVRKVPGLGKKREILTGIRLVTN